MIPNESKWFKMNQNESKWFNMNIIGPSGCSSVSAGSPEASFGLEEFKFLAVRIACRAPYWKYCRAVICELELCDRSAEKWCSTFSSLRRPKPGCQGSSNSVLVRQTVTIDSATACKLASVCWARKQDPEGCRSLSHVSPATTWNKDRQA